jgi:hypothetical protein
VSEYAWHEAALRGEARPLVNGVCVPGFFRLQRNGDTPLPVAVWEVDGELLGVVGNPNVIDPIPADERFFDRVFQWCAKRPISAETFWKAAESGEWPDAPPENGARSNLPDDPFEALRIEIEGEVAEVERWLRSAHVADQSAADLCANWAERISGLEKRAVEMRVAEKRPHDEAGKAVMARFAPLVESAENGKQALKQALAPYLSEQRRREEAERQAALARGEAPARTNGKAAAGTTGRRVALRTTASAVIEDWPAFAAWLLARENADLRAELQRIADRMARAGASAPGIRVERVESVA